MLEKSLERERSGRRLGQVQVRRLACQVASQRDALRCMGLLIPRRSQMTDLTDCSLILASLEASANFPIIVWR